MENRLNTVSLDYDSFSQPLSLISHESPYGSDGKTFIRIAEEFAEALPIKLRQAIRSFSRYSNKEGYLLVKVNDFNTAPCDTPSTMKDPWKKTDFSTELFIAALGSLLGDVFTYKQMNNGVLVHNLFPIRSESSDLSSLSSNIMLDLHNEAAFHPFNPEYLIIGCMRSDRNKKATSIVSSITYALPDLSPEIIEILRQPLFQTGIQHNSIVEGPGPVIPILFGDIDDPFINFDPDLMIALTEEAKVAMQALKNALDRHRIEFLLNDGEFLLLDNSKILHGRYPFEAYFDGKDRWLQRVYVTKRWLGAKIAYQNSSRALFHDFGNIPVQYGT